MDKQIVLDTNVIKIKAVNKDDYICISDIAKLKDDETRAIDRIKNWLRTQSTIEYLGLWEQLHNPDFKVVEFDHFKNEAGANHFVLNPQQWIEKTNAIGIQSYSGRYGGTYAHKDIAFEFATWISPAFKLRLIIEYQELKEEFSNQQHLQWDVHRYLSKQAYLIQTTAVKEHLLSKTSLPEDKHWLKYAQEADVLNKAVFGITAKQWKDNNPDLIEDNKNIRDYATANELKVLNNLQSQNAYMIEKNIDKQDRFEQLLSIAIRELEILNKNSPEDSKQKIKDNRTITNKKIQNNKKTIDEKIHKIIEEIKNEVLLPRNLWQYALVVMYNSENGIVNTNNLYDEIPKLVDIPKEFLAPLKGRSDTKFTQYVRNLKSHKNQKSNFIYQGYAEIIDKGFKITQKGISFVENEILVTKEEDSNFNNNLKKALDYKE